MQLRYTKLRFTVHALQRMRERGVDREKVRQVVTYGTERRAGHGSHGRGYSYTWRGVAVIMDVKKSLVITVLDLVREKMDATYGD